MYTHQVVGQPDRPHTEEDLKKGSSGHIITFQYLNVLIVFNKYGFCLFVSKYLVSRSQDPNSF